MIYELRHKHELKAMLAYLEIPKSTYFYIINTFTRKNKNIDIENKIREIFDQQKGRYGYDRIVLALANKGIKVNHKKVKRIMKDKSLFARQHKKIYKCIEYYNKERIKTKLKGLSPYFYRQQSLNSFVLM